MSFFAPPNSQLNHSQAKNCLLMNLLAFPGLGTLMAGRRKIGWIQTGLMLVGFFCAIGYIGLFVYREVHLLFNMSANAEEHDATRFSFWWVGAGGFGMCLIAWVWSLFTSMEILRSVPEVIPALLEKPPVIEESNDSSKS